MITPDVNMITEGFINGQAFSATTGKLTSVATAVTGLAIFNPATNTKTLFFFSARGATSGSGGGGHQLNIVTVDPALGTSVIPTNGQSTSKSTSIATCSSANAAITLSGTQYDTQQAIGNQTFEFLASNSFLVCPPGSGILIAVSTASTVWFASAKWLEL